MHFVMQAVFSAFACNPSGIVAAPWRPCAQICLVKRSLKTRGCS